MKIQLNKYSSINVTISEYEKRFSLLGKEIDRLNLVLREKAGELNDALNQNRMLQEDSRKKDEYINELEKKKVELDQQCA